MAEVFSYYCPGHEVEGHGDRCWMWDAPNADCLLVRRSVWHSYERDLRIFERPPLWATVPELIGNSDTFMGVRAE